MSSNTSSNTLGTKRIFICGSALRGQPNHENLGNAKFIRPAETKPLYRLHAAENGWHPAIYKVDLTGVNPENLKTGISIPGEVYELSLEEFKYLSENEPPHMYPSDVILEDEEVLTAFLYPRELIEKYQWQDISDLGGWAAYKNNRSNLDREKNVETQMNQS
jgi:gamma-glutamylaminecyclotransferase